VNVSFLTKGVWPILSAEFKAESFPVSVLKNVAEFLEKDYEAKNKGKSIVWALECGNAMVQFRTN
jgi:hypothetical protein